jgi:hypothetical protein
MEREGEAVGWGDVGIGKRTLPVSASERSSSLRCQWVRGQIPSLCEGFL